jgi:hypothetical protein
MRRISSRQREEPTKGRLDVVPSASYLLAPRPDAQPLDPPRHPTAPKDFTAQVMARLATPPPAPDPRQVRARARRARAGVVARVYIALTLVAALGVAIAALVAPWALITVVVSVVGALVALLAGAAFIARATGGFVSGFGVIYAAMLALLTPALLMLASRMRRRRAHVQE